MEKHMMYRQFAVSALKSAAFEERMNKDREAADWWRARASLWFRRAAVREGGAS